MEGFLGALNKFGEFAGDVSNKLGEVQVRNLMFDNPELYSQIMTRRQEQQRLGDLANLEKQNIQSQIQARQQQLEQQRIAAQQEAQRKRQMGDLIQRMTGAVPEGQMGPMPPMSTEQVLGSLAAITGDPTGLLEYRMQQNTPKYMEVGGALLQVGPDGVRTVYSQPSEFQENLQMLGALQALPPDMQDLYTRLYGKGGTTVNVGGGDSFDKKFNEALGSGLGDQVVTLGKEAEEILMQAAGSERALQILTKNPNIDISPTAKISADFKSFFAPYLSQEQLESVADFQQLDSQLIRNRFDVTQVLKGAITEQEQEAAQQVAGTATGTRLGLQKTLINNMAFAALQADEKQRRAEYIREMGENYKPSEFKEYYKRLGEMGQRPTLDKLLQEYNAMYGAAGPSEPVAVNPETGQKVILRGGKWQPL